MLTKVSVVFIATIFSLISIAFPQETGFIANFVPDASQGLKVAGQIVYDLLSNGLVSVRGQLNSGFDQSSNKSDYEFFLDDHRYDDYLNYTILNGGTSAFASYIPAEVIGFNDKKKRGDVLNKRPVSKINYNDQTIGKCICQDLHLPTN
ncbi:5831_t:CDS:1 [Ambispora leptoticha]|uniref:5831_t:CDS:1 n=1 Tax=Ambispora leptoticha TaxID=144679 RepID=A0A9N9GEQ1_9GLOM|nr:5831_t:CDS:1 [Ambispora leptoticha]